MSQNTVVLNRTNDKMPLVGFGTARIKAEDTEEVIYKAIKTGYRLIDGALAYENEAEVGKAVRRAIADGIVKREDLFSKYFQLVYQKKKKLITAHHFVVVGKLWNNFHSKDHVRRIFDMTLENYGLDYIDLYLIHCKYNTQ
jgi:D-xylose reductase